MISRLGRTCKQALKQVGRNRAMSFASVFAITAMLLILGLFFVLIVNVNMVAESIKEDYNSIEIFMLDSTTEEEIAAIQEDVASWDYVDDVTYRSKEEAMDILKVRWGDNAYLLDSLTENPLPNSLVVTMTDLSQADQLVSKAENIEGVEDILYYKDTVESLLKVIRVLKIAALVIMGFLILVSIVVVSNTIKLTVFNRSEEIQIMKYVGATNWYIRGPFMMEGIFIGFFSALISAGIVAFLYSRIIASLGGVVASVLSIPMVPLGFLAVRLVLIFVALGVSIGAWGSIVSMRRFLDT